MRIIKWIMKKQEAIIELKNETKRSEKKRTDKKDKKTEEK